MLDVKDAEARAASLIETARKAGADAADVLYVGNGSTEVQVRLGDLEDVQRSEGEELGLRFFLGKPSASGSSSDLSAETRSARLPGAAARAPGHPGGDLCGVGPAGAS